MPPNISISGFKIQIFHRRSHQDTFHECYPRRYGYLPHIKSGGNLILRLTRNTWPGKPIGPFYLSSDKTVVEVEPNEEQGQIYFERSIPILTQRRRDHTLLDTSPYRNNLIVAYLNRNNVFHVHKTSIFSQWGNMFLYTGEDELDVHLNDGNKTIPQLRGRHSKLADFLLTNFNGNSAPDISRYRRPTLIKEGLGKQEGSVQWFDPSVGMGGLVTGEGIHAGFYVHEVRNARPKEDEWPYPVVFVRGQVLEIGGLVENPHKGKSNYKYFAKDLRR